MLRLLACCVVLLAGCTFAAAGSGTDGNVSWAFTITNTLPDSAVIGGGGGLVVVITYDDGSTRTQTVPPGGSLTIPSNGTAAVVNGGGSSASAGPGTDLFWTISGWSTTPPSVASPG